MCGAAVPAIGSPCATICRPRPARFSLTIERLRAAQGVLRLQRPYGAARLEAACARALAHGSPFYRTVKTILAGGFDRHPPSDSSDHVHAPGARFARNAQSLFAPDADVRH